MQETTGATDAIETEWELRRLAERYAVAMDTRDSDELRRLFVPDGALVVRAPGKAEPLGVFRGAGSDGIGLIADLLDRLYDSTMHHVTGQLVEIDGDEATGRTYCLAYHICNDEQGRRLETLGVAYDDRFVCTEGGWRFRTRDATRLWSQITPTPREPLLVDRAAARARR
jgi:hypothetical protein